MSEQPIVVAVSGMSGSGKSSVIRRAAPLLSGASRIHFDDYEETSTYPADLGDWLRRGGDLGEWKTPRLAEDLRNLRAGRTISLPGNRGTVGPAEYILVEEPLGKAREETGQHIDIAIHLDVPVDLLLARRFLRRLTEERQEIGDRLEDVLLKDIHHHMDCGRDLNLYGNELARGHADHVLDGRKSLDETTEDLVAAVRVLRKGI